MRYSLRLFSLLTGIKLFAWISVIPVAAQVTNPTKFDLNRYDFDAGSSYDVAMTLSVRNSQADMVELHVPYVGVEIAVESVTKISAGITSEFWLTKDSILFKRKLSQTALVISRSSSVVIQTASFLKSGDQIVIRLRMALPLHIREQKEHVSSSKTEDKSMVVSLSNSIVSGSTMSYFSAKPITIKHRDASYR